MTMTFWTLARRSFRYHWRAHLGVLLGAAVGTAVLVGALAVGDCMRASLRALALSRLGRTRLTLVAGGQYFRGFRAQLAQELGQDLHTDCAPVLLLPGSALDRATSQRAGHVQVIGVDDRFWRLAPRRPELPQPWNRGAVINTQMARTTGAKVGDELLIYMDKPSALPRDAALSAEQSPTIASP